MAKSHEDVNPQQSVEVQEADDSGADDRLFQNRGSMAIIGCRPTRVWEPALQVQIAENGGLLEMADIFGQLRGLTEVKKLKDQQSGLERDSWGLVGDIEAINLETGTFHSFPVFYFPSGFHEAFLTEIKAQLAENSGNAFVEFGVRMYARKQPTSYNQQGYSWTMRNVAGVRRRDPLANLRQRMLAARPALTALPSPGSAPRQVASN